MRFRTIRLSTPEFERDNLRFMVIKTPNLKGRGDICVFVPSDIDADDLPVVILLHGVYGSAWSWAFGAGAHLTAQQMIIEGQIKPMILAMPSDGLWGDGSGYLVHDGQDFEKWIAEDVPDAIRMNIPQATNSSTLFINGLSMGGFGALRIGSKYPEKFKAIAGHSAITSLDQMKLFVEEPLEAYKQFDEEDEDIYLTMQRKKDRLPPIRFDCGKDDLLIEHNRKLHQQMSAAGIPHEYEEFEGAHEWSYWAEHLKDMLLFFNKYG